MEDTQNGTPAPEVASEPTPEANKTVRHKEPPSPNGGPGFVTVTNRMGRSVKVKVDNIRVTLEDLKKRPDLAEFFKNTEYRYLVDKRESV